MSEQKKPLHQERQQQSLGGAQQVSQSHPQPRQHSPKIPASKQHPQQILEQQQQQQHQLQQSLDQARRRSPNRNLPRSLTPNFFAKPKKSEASIPPTQPHGTTKSSGKKKERRSSLGEKSSDHLAAPELGEHGIVPKSPITAQSGSKNKAPKPATAGALNNHYRTISRSVNDIFQRGGNREPSPRPSPVDSRRQAVSYPSEHAESGGGYNIAAAALVPSNSVAHGATGASGVSGVSGYSGAGSAGHLPTPQISVSNDSTSKGEVIKDGWVNVIDSAYSKKASSKEGWRLQHAVLSGGYLCLYKPLNLPVKYFDITAPSSVVPRPKTAPATGPVSQDTGRAIKFQLLSKHPELAVDEDGKVISGSIEAICHELMFGSDLTFCEHIILSLSAWSTPETVFAILAEYAEISSSPARVEKILRLVIERTRSVLISPGVQLAIKRLLSKGVRQVNPQFAIELQKDVDASLSAMLEAISFYGLVTKSFQEDEDEAEIKPLTLNADELLSINPEIIACQIHIFHKKFLSIWSPTTDMSLLMLSPFSTHRHRNPLMFTTSSVHFLTEHIFLHILSPDISSARRAALLATWIDVGQFLQERGDMVGWFAITMAVLSPAVLRLRHTWDLLDFEKLDVVEREWAPVMLDLERRKFEVDKAEAVRPSVMAPGGVGKLMPFEDVVPYFGDLSLCMSDAHQSGGKSVDCHNIFEGLAAIEAGLERWKRYPSGSDADDPPASMAELGSEIRPFQRCLLSMNSKYLTPSSIYSQSLFDISLSCEPLSTGTYLHVHYHQKLPLSTGANIPLILTDVIARFSLFDRQDTLAIAESLNKKVSANNLGNVNDNSVYLSPASRNMLPSPGMDSSPSLRRTRSFPPSRDTTHTTGYDRLDLTTRERAAGLQSNDQGMLRTIWDVTGVGQKVFHSQDGELILKCINGDTTLSRPSSVIENTSKRASTASKRRVSATEAITSPTSAADTGHEKNTTSPVDVVAKGGTLERLVDILALGVEEFSTRVVENSKRGPKLSMDMEVYRTTFLATFRSYCSPIVLLDYLRKRLVGSRSAAALDPNDNDDIVFPDWTGIVSTREDAVDWTLVAKIHIGILEALKHWVDDFFVDFHSDITMRESFLAFLVVAAKEFSVWDTLALNDGDTLQSSADQIENLFEDVRETFERQSFRADQTSLTHAVSNSGILLLPTRCSLDVLEDFIDKLESSLSYSFHCVSLIDWMVSIEVLENQASEQTGFLVPRLVAQASEEDEVIQDIFFLLGKLQKHGTNEPLMAGLPISLQELLSLRSSMVNWILAQVVDADINIEERSQRIYSLLRCVSLCQARMSTMDIYDRNEGRNSRQQVPAFITTAIATALVRPESRTFTLAWMNAAELSTSKAMAPETLQEIIPGIKKENLGSSSAMTPCPGWLIERILEIVCHVPNMLVENSRLINFDKRRYVFNLVSNFTSLDSQVKDNPGMAPFEGSVFLFDQQAQMQVIPPFHSLDVSRVDKKHWRDMSSRENTALKGSKLRVFTKLVQHEHEKQRRDNRLREVIDRQHKDQLRAIGRRNPALKVDMAADRKGGRRLGVTNLFKAVRPISMAFSSSWTPPQSGRLLSPFDLPPPRSVEFRNKPSISLDLGHVVSVSYPSSMRTKFMWKIRSDDGATFIIQSVGEEEADDWLRVISSVRGVPYTIDGTESLDNVAATVTTKIVQVTLPRSANVPQAFGVPIEELCRRDGVKIPVVVESLLSEIERRGLDEVGLYRIPGSVNSIAALKHALDTEPDVRMDDDKWYDINAVAGAFKLFIREIPHPLIPLELLNDFREIARESNEECRVEFFSCLVLQLPVYCYNFLRRMYMHLHMVSENCNTNKMTSVNLAIVFGMGMAPDPSTGFGINPDLGIYQTIVRTWISFAPTIFQEIDDDDHVDKIDAFAVSSAPPPGSPTIPTPPSGGLVVVPRLARPHSQRFQPEDVGRGGGASPAPPS